MVSFNEKERSIGSIFWQCLLALQVGGINLLTTFLFLYEIYIAFFSHESGTRVRRAKCHGRLCTTSFLAREAPQLRTMMPWRPWLLSQIQRDCQAINSAIVSPLLLLQAQPDSPPPLPPRHSRGANSSFYSSDPTGQRKDIKNGAFRLADFPPQVRPISDHRLTLFPLAALHSAGEATADVCPHENEPLRLRL